MLVVLGGTLGCISHTSTLTEDLTIYFKQKKKAKKQRGGWWECLATSTRVVRSRIDETQKIAHFILECFILRPI